PNQAAQLALGHLQADVVHGDDTAEAHAERPGFQNWRHGLSPRRSRRRMANPVGSNPLGTTRTTIMRITPRSRFGLMSRKVPAQIVSICSRIQPMIGPASVPNPPTMTQMMI